MRTEHNCVRIHKNTQSQISAYVSTGSNIRTCWSLPTESVSSSSWRSSMEEMGLFLTSSTRAAGRGSPWNTHTRIYILIWEKTHILGLFFPSRVQDKNSNLRISHPFHPASDTFPSSSSEEMKQHGSTAATIVSSASVCVCQTKWSKCKQSCIPSIKIQRQT